jgi:hypothetical protein
MDWVSVAEKLLVPLLREFGFPVLVALGALGLVGAMAWQMHRFVTGRLVDVIERSSAALQSSADHSGEVAHELDRLAEHVAQCPQRSPAGGGWTPRHATAQEN